MSVYTALLTYSDGTLVFAGSTKEILERKLIDHANAMPREDAVQPFTDATEAMRHIEDLYGAGEIELEEHPE